MPILSRTPARIAEAGPGALTWAGGSQVCTGKTGVLMPKPMTNARNTSPGTTPAAASGGVSIIARMSKVSVGMFSASTMMPMRISSDPASV